MHRKGMHVNWKRSNLLVVMVAAVAMSSAENYQAVVYGYPAGFNSMFVKGGGEDGLVSGYGPPSSQPGIEHAVYMTPQGARDMHPAGNFSKSYIFGSWGATYHVGAAFYTSDVNYKAFFWIGGGAGINLHPAGDEYDGSQAMGGGGQLQAGFVTGEFFCSGCGQTISGNHAGMWSRTAASFSRLHAVNHRNTQALATDGQRQAGVGSDVTTNHVNGLLWNGPNSTAVNLHPAGYAESWINTIQGSKQGGWVSAELNGNTHAALWTSSAASMIDLNPSAFVSSEVSFLRNGLQVGTGSTESRSQAVAWHGAAGTWINLHARLPAQFLYWNSFAKYIDSQGNIVGYITDQLGFVARPVIWKRI
jgi:hypothetical protein